MTANSEITAPSAFSYVYLLPHRSEPRFKIGKADDVTIRARALPESFDLQSARALRFDNAEMAFNAERVLHRLAARYKVKDLPWGVGYTEWFDLSCFSDILVVVETHLKTWLGLLDVSAVPTTPPCMPPVKLGGLSPTKQKIFERRRGVTEGILFSERWVSPTENHALFKQLLTPILEDVISLTPNVEVGWNRGDFRFWGKPFPKATAIKALAPPSRRLWAFEADPGYGPAGPIRHFPVLGACNDVRNGAFLSILDYADFIYVCDIVQEVWLKLGGSVWASIENFRENDRDGIRTRIPFNGSVSSFLNSRTKKYSTQPLDPVVASTLRGLRVELPLQ